MLSGLPGQKFFFQGYLDKDPVKRKKLIQQLANQSQNEKATQIFIEAPYRNRHAVEVLLHSLPESFQLCIAWDITLQTQGVMTCSIQQWKKCSLPNLEKKPAIFLFSAPY
jgi:16S rRNA (cytidine1402-2'-O)-methyltransferase